RGIRPAFGYPACPDHVEKRTLFALLDAERAGLGLTESCAMTPAASVSGICLHHPEARYFTVDKLGRDQVEDYARRRGVAVAEVEQLHARQAITPSNRTFSRHVWRVSARSHRVTTAGILPARRARSSWGGPERLRRGGERLATAPPISSRAR